MKVYGASGVDFLPEAQAKLKRFTEAGLGGLPICMAKTHLSISHDPALKGAPRGFTVPVRDLRAYTGAGFVTALCGTIVQMPGLGKTPAGFNIDIDVDAARGPGRGGAGLFGPRTWTRLCTTDAGRTAGAGSGSEVGRGVMPWRARTPDAGRPGAPTLRPRASATRRSASLRSRHPSTVTVLPGSRSL